jgi:type II secretory pathway predicted ATPase ExeA
MYLEYYNLKIKPFDLALKPGFLWLGEKHSEALATLKYGIQEDLGFLLLTGDVGAGKTVMIRRLVNSLDRGSTIVAHITDPGLAPADFFKMLASEFKLGREYEGKAEFLIQFKRFLNKAHADKKKVVLIIDEAQRLDDDLLDHIRVLSNIEKANKKMINIFFVGQPEFKNMLLSDANRPLRQRIAVNYHIDPLTEPEVGEYIAYRLEKAGRVQNLFTPDAVTEIFKFTSGYPRAINIICDHALLTGFSSGLKKIDSNVIKECKQELKIKAEEIHEKAEGNQAQEKQKQEKPTPVVSAPDPSPPIPPQKKRRAASLGGYSLIIAVCILLSALLVYLLMRPDPDAVSPQAAEEQSEVFANHSTNPLENDEWRLEDKIEMDKSYASSKLSTETIPPATSNAEGPATSDAASDLSSVSDTNESETAAIASLTAPETEEAREATKRTQPEPTEPVVEKKATPSDEEKKAVVAEQPPKAESSQTATSPSEPPVKSSESASTVALPDKSLQAMAVMSAAMAAKPETEKPKSTATKKTVNKSTTVTKKKSAASKPKASSTAPKEKTSPKTTQKSVASVKQAEKKIEEKPRVTPLEKTKPNTALAAVVAASEPKKKTATPVPKTGSPKVATPKTATDTAPSKATLDSKTKMDQAPKATADATAIAAASPKKKSPETKSDAGLENRLRWFLKSYCVTYTRKDIDAFSKFFVSGATENGKPFESLIPKYKRNFENIETIQYRIDLKDFSYDENKEIVQVEGDFALQWLPGDRKWRENSGKISMTLIDSGPSFLVQSLEYRGARTKK